MHVSSSMPTASAGEQKTIFSVTLDGKTLGEFEVDLRPLSGAQLISRLCRRFPELQEGAFRLFLWSPDLRLEVTAEHAAGRAHRIVQRERNVPRWVLEAEST